MERGNTFAGARPPGPVEPLAHSATPISWRDRRRDGAGCRSTWNPVARRSPTLVSDASTSPLLCAQWGDAADTLANRSKLTPAGRRPACSAARICCATGTRSASLGKDLAGKPSEDRSSMGQVVSPFHVERRAAFASGHGCRWAPPSCFAPRGATPLASTVRGRRHTNLPLARAGGRDVGLAGRRSSCSAPSGAAPRSRKGRRATPRLSCRFHVERQLSPSRGGMPTHHPICSAPWAGTAV